jgi:hypothetical protein
MDFESTGAFYRAAHLGLRVLDSRGVRRRFGAEADARWAQFRGDMTDADRLDLLLREAAAQAPLAFAPREVFALEGLSLEDPFGASWKGPPRGLSGSLLRSENAVASDAVAAFDEAVALWEVSIPAMDASSLPRIVASSRVVVGGLAALRAIVAHFAAHRGSFDLADQVLFVADRPVERQLFGLATVFLATPGVGRAVPPRASVEKVRALGRTPFDAKVVSDDASDAVRETVHALADALGR